MQKNKPDNPLKEKMSIVVIWILLLFTGLDCVSLSQNREKFSERSEENYTGNRNIFNGTSSSFLSRRLLYQDDVQNHDYYEDGILNISEDGTKDSTKITDVDLLKSGKVGKISRLIRKTKCPPKGKTAKGEGKYPLQHMEPNRATMLNHNGMVIQSKHEMMVREGLKAKNTTKKRPCNVKNLQILMPLKQHKKNNPSNIRKNMKRPIHRSQDGMNQHCDSAAISVDNTNERVVSGVEPTSKKTKYYSSIIMKGTKNDIISKPRDNCGKAMCDNGKDSTERKYKNKGRRNEMNLSVLKPVHAHIKEDVDTALGESSGYNKDDDGSNSVMRKLFHKIGTLKDYIEVKENSRICREISLPYSLHNERFERKVPIIEEKLYENDNEFL